jgi:hypothetical protein
MVYYGSATNSRNAQHTTSFSGDQRPSIELTSLFDPPKRLPPPRSHCHTITLIPGVVPFCLHPYHYNPAQKDEIERQIVELLKNGMTQPSCNPFASPVILGRKK